MRVAYRAHSAQREVSFLAASKEQVHGCGQPELLRFHKGTPGCLGLRGRAQIHAMNQRSQITGLGIARMQQLCQNTCRAQSEQRMAAGVKVALRVQQRVGIRS